MVGSRRTLVARAERTVEAAIAMRRAEARTDGGG